MKETYKKLDSIAPIKGFRTDLETGKLVPTNINKVRLKLVQFLQKSK